MLFFLSIFCSNELKFSIYFNPFSFAELLPFTYIVEWEVIFQQTQSNGKL